MTTNVRDSLRGMFAADSRWSIDCRPRKNLIFVVDTSGYNKIVPTKNVVYMFAGNSRIIESWKSNIRLAEQGEAFLDWDALPLDSIAVSIVEIGTGLVLFEEGHEIRRPDESARTASFSGTGSVSACTCWEVNHDPIRAVETAKGTDIFTGGDVKFFEFQTSHHNVSDDVSWDAFLDAFCDEEKVMVVTTNFGAPTPAVAVKDLPVTALDIKEEMQNIKTGKLTPVAPCDALHNTWTATQKQRLVDLMKKLYPRAQPSVDEPPVNHVNR